VPAISARLGEVPARPDEPRARGFTPDRLSLSSRVLGQSVTVPPREVALHLGRADVEVLAARRRPQFLQFPEPGIRRRRAVGLRSALTAVSRRAARPGITRGVDGAPSGSSLEQLLHQGFIFPLVGAGIWRLIPRPIDL